MKPSWDRKGLPTRGPPFNRPHVLVDLANGDAILIARLKVGKQTDRSVPFDPQNAPGDIKYYRVSGPVYQRLKLLDQHVKALYDGLEGQVPGLRFHEDDFRAARYARHALDHYLWHLHSQAKNKTTSFTSPLILKAIDDEYVTHVINCIERGAKITALGGKVRSPTAQIYLHLRIASPGHLNHKLQSTDQFATYHDHLSWIQSLKQCARR